MRTQFRFTHYFLVLLILSVSLLLGFRAHASSPMIWQSPSYGKIISSLGFMLNDSKAYRILSADPTAGAGIAAAVGSVGVRSNAGAGEMWLKTGAGDTAWEQLATFPADLASSDVTGILPNNKTTAASANTASAIVARDGSGNFSAGTITATLTGNVTGNLTGNASTATALASNPSDCAANTFANAIAASGNLTCAAINLASADVTGVLPNANTTAASANTASAIVARDGSGNFSAGTITAALSGNASTATALAANPSDCGAGTKAISIDASGNLTCSAVSLTADVSGTLPIANGGTNKALTLSAGGVPYFDADSFEVLSAGTTGQLLTSGGSGAPTWTTSVPIANGGNAGAAIYSALVNCSSSSSTTKEYPSGWITGNPANISGNRCTITIDNGIFSAAPVCWTEVGGTSTTVTYGTQISIPSATSLTIGCVTNTGATTAACTNNDFIVVCMGLR